MRHIKELDGLRGLMALWVVAGHSYEAIPSLSKFIPMTLMNDFAVDVFIVLSGFVIFNYLNNNSVSYRQYITQRAMRLFPIYLVVLALTISSIYFYRDILTISPDSPSTEYRIYQVDVFLDNAWQHIIPHLFLLQGLIPDRVLHLVGTTIVGQAWSASVEWQFYLVAPFLFVFFNKLIKQSNMRAVMTILMSIVIIMIASKLMANKAFVGSSLSSFFVGFLSFFYFRDFYPKASTHAIRLIGLCVIATTILLLKKECIGYLIWFIVFFSVLLRGKTGSENIVTKPLSNWLVLAIGKVSYSIYMVHMLVIYFTLYLFVELSVPIGVHYAWLVPMSMLASFIISIYTFKYIEHPMMLLGKKMSIVRV